jgi:hypothetical protein
MDTLITNLENVADVAVFEDSSTYCTRQLTVTTGGRRRSDPPGSLGGPNRVGLTMGDGQPSKKQTKVRKPLRSRTSRKAFANICDELRERAACLVFSKAVTYSHFRHLMISHNNIYAASLFGELKAYAAYRAHAIAPDLVWIGPADDHPGLLSVRCNGRALHLPKSIQSDNVVGRVACSDVG